MSLEPLSSSGLCFTWSIAVEISHAVNIGPLPFKIFTHIAFWAKSSACGSWALMEAITRVALGGLFYLAISIGRDARELYEWKDYFFKGAAVSLAAYVFFLANTLTLTFASHVLKDVCPSRIEAFLIAARTIHRVE